MYPNPASSEESGAGLRPAWTFGGLQLLPAVE